MLCNSHAFLHGFYNLSSYLSFMLPASIPLKRLFSVIVALWSVGSIQAASHSEAYTNDFWNPNAQTIESGGYGHMESAENAVPWEDHAVFWGGVGSLVLYGIGVLLLPALTLPATLLAMAALLGAVYVRRKRGRKNWRTLMGLLAAGGVVLVFLAAVGLILFF